MIKGLPRFLLHVTDVNRAVQFYTQAIGMKKVHGHVGHLNLGLHWTEIAPIPLY